MNGKKKKIIIGTGVVFGAAMLALCGYGLSFLDKEELYTDADYGEWVVTTAPTCDKKGVETRALLASSSVTQTRDIPALGHDWGEWEEDIQPTCTAGGSNKRKCAICHNYDYEPVPELGHDWGEWETARAATCLVAGYDKRVCTHDEKHIDLRITEATGHDWSDWTVFVAPTCTEEGVEQCVCRYDNFHIQQRTAAALGHDWNDPVVTKAPTCTSTGTLTAVCRNDSLHTETESLPALGHDWGEWVTTTAPTYFEEGEETRICANDSSHIEKNTLPILMNAELVYDLIDDGASYSVHLTNHNEVIGTVEIPATHNGLPVTEIRGNGFVNCPQLYRVVVLGNNLETIGSNAFTNCTMLKEVVIAGGGLKEIGNNAFAKCTALESFAIPEGVERVGTYLFRGCTNLKSLSIPASLTNFNTLPWSLAYQCSALETVTVAKGNKVYRSENNCIIERATNTVVLGIKSSVIPYSATAIGKYAFWYSKIESVTIPSSVTTIKGYAFAWCRELKSVIFAGDSLDYLGYAVFRNSPNISELELPASIAAVKGEAFYGWTEGQKVIVKGFAFEEDADAAWGSDWRKNTGATIIYDAEVTEQLTFLLNAGDASYKVRIHDKTLTSVTIPATYKGLPVTGLADSAFMGCNELTTVVILGNNLQRIGNNAFMRCLKLENFEIPQGVTSIGSNAFSYCTLIKRIEIPAGVTVVGMNTFKNWTEEQTIVVRRFDSEEEADICWEGWRGSCNAVVHCRTDIEYEYDDQLAFGLYANGTEYRVKALNQNISGTVTIPATYKGLPVTEILDAAFAGCNKIENIVVLGNNLKSIGRTAFALCSALESFDIPEGVTKIGYRAFYECDSLKSVSVPASVTDLSNHEFLYRCPALESITVAEGNGTFRSEGNCLIDRATNILLLGGKNAVIPAGISGIRNYAFAYTGIESVRIPESVTKIGKYAFSNCSLLTEVVFEGNGLIEIGDCAFYECSGITQLTLPASVKSIKQGAFIRCTGITQLELPASISEVRESVFFGWTEEQTIIVKGYASKEEAAAAWVNSWTDGCNATIIYDKEETEV